MLGAGHFFRSMIDIPLVEHYHDFTMKRLVISILLLFAMIFSLGCNAPPPTASSFNLIFKYGVGAKNELNTFNGTYTKDMVMDPSITVNLSLSKEELDRIYQKMVEIDFFDYPDEFKVTVFPWQSKGLRTPYSSYYFRVEYDSKTKELSWKDNILTNDRRAEKLRELIELIRDIIESKEEYEKLPPARGGYI